MTARPRIPIEGPYEPISPTATYAPWKADEAFREAYALVRENTLVDEYRLWELWSLVRQTSDLNGHIVEVGVWRGGSGALMARRAQLDDSRSTIYLCDTFRGVVKASERDSTYKGGEWADTSRETVEGFARSVGLTNVRVVEGVFPDETARELPPDITLRMCHIDVDTYDSARDVLHWAWPRLAVGGVVVFDDYGFWSCDGVARLVDAETAAADDRLTLYNLNGHAVMVKTR
jgi:O-methyltransferase